MNNKIKTILNSLGIDADANDYCFVQLTEQGTWAYSETQTKHIMIKSDLKKEDNQLLPALSIRYKEPVWIVLSSKDKFVLSRDSKKSLFYDICYQSLKLPCKRYHVLASYADNKTYYYYAPDYDYENHRGIKFSYDISEATYICNYEDRNGKTLMFKTPIPVWLKDDLTIECPICHTEHLRLENIYKGSGDYLDPNNYYQACSTCFKKKVGKHYTLYLEDLTKLNIPVETLDRSELENNKELVFIPNEGENGIWLSLSYVESSSDYVKDYFTNEYISKYFDIQELYGINGLPLGLTIEEPETIESYGFEKEIGNAWHEKED